MLEQHGARLRHERSIEPSAIDGGSVQWLIDRALGAEHLMVYRLTVEPDSMASHVHVGSEEALYVLEGSGEVRVEHSIYSVRGGQSGFAREGHTHCYGI